MTRHDYAQAGQEAVNYLLRHIQADGSFDYKFHATKGVLPGEYNLLRHAGTLYALYQWKHINGMSARDILLTESPLDYLMRRLQHPEHANFMLFVADSSDEIKLGAVALTLLAMTERSVTGPDKDELKIMQSFAEFILWMQEPSGKFISKLFYDQRQFSSFESLYYPGEAILALLRLYNFDPDPRWLQAAVHASDYLLQYPVLDKKGRRAHNHWFAIALAELLHLLPREDFQAEFCKIVEDTMSTLQNKIDQGASSASLATRGETIIAALHLEQLQLFPVRIAGLREALDLALAYCLRLQIKDEQYPQASARGGIRKSEHIPLIRIDYVQHTLQVISGVLKSGHFS